MEITAIYDRDNGREDLAGTVLSHISGPCEALPDGGTPATPSSVPDFFFPPHATASPQPSEPDILDYRPGHRNLNAEEYITLAILSWTRLEKTRQTLHLRGVTVLKHCPIQLVCVRSHQGKNTTLTHKTKAPAVAGA